MYTIMDTIVTFKKNKYSYYNATCTGYTNSNIQYMRDHFTSRLCSFGKVFI